MDSDTRSGKRIATGWNAFGAKGETPKAKSGTSATRPASAELPKLANKLRSGSRRSGLAADYRV